MPPTLDVSAQSLVTFRGKIHGPRVEREVALASPQYKQVPHGAYQGTPQSLRDKVLTDAGIPTYFLGEPIIKDAIRRWDCNYHK
jgi:hypothetical protein